MEEDSLTCKLEKTPLRHLKPTNILLKQSDIPIIYIYILKMTRKVYKKKHYQGTI